MATAIGIIKAVIGKVEGVGLQGSSPLHVGDKVFADQIITTGLLGAVEIEFLDGSIMDLGRNSQVVLDKEIFDPIAFAQANNDVQDDVDALQQALLDGTDPTQVGDATAAGPESQQGGNEGTTSVSVDFIAPEVSITSGFETSGPSSENVPRESFDGSNTLGQLLSGDLSVAVDDTGIEVVEDTSIIINVLANDTIGAGSATITSNTTPSNGTLVLNSNGTFSYTPSANYSGTDSFTYTLTDSNGNISTATANINVAPVADAPTLILSMGLPVVELETETHAQTINISNVNTSDNGFSVSAGDALISINTHPNHSGFGVTGRASGDYSELGFIGGKYSEELDVKFDLPVDSVAVSFAWLNPNESAEFLFYSDGVLVGSGTHKGGTDAIDPAMTLKPSSGNSFDEIIFRAPGTGDDYLIHSIDFNIVTVVKTTYTYDMSLNAALTDVDGSESLSGITLSGLPTGATIQDIANSDGTYNSGKVTLVSDHELSVDEVNSIQGKVTATDGSDTATTQINVKIEVADLDATGNSSDLLLRGDDSANTISGGDGNDILIGGKGNDILSGGLGNDTFIWNQDDIATPAHDTILDFDKNNDVLNLADLLSDPALGYSIEGIDNGGELQINIGAADADGHIATPVQEISLNGVAIVGSVEDTLQSLLNSGAINDGI